MYEIEFFEDKNGKSEVADFIKELNRKAVTKLEEFGTRVGTPVTKHLDGEIWELLPLKNRLLYAYYKDNKFRRHLNGKLNRQKET